MAAFRVNVVGVAFGTNAFLPLIRAGSTKKVITLGTGLAMADLTNQFELQQNPAYSISKAATNMLVAKYNAAYGKSEGILFLSLSPGFVDTGTNTTPLNDDDAKAMQDMGAKFAKYAPHFTGPITTEESVKAMDKVITIATAQSMGGAAVSHHGNQEWL